MKFLTVLIVIFWYRNWIGEHPARPHVPFGRYVDWFRSNVSVPGLRFGLCVGVPVMIVLLLAAEIGSWLLGLPWLILAIVVMVYCVEIIDVEARFADHAVALQALAEDGDLQSVQMSQDAFKQSTVYDVFQSLYPALFWFLVLGPAGALAYTFARDYAATLPEDDDEIEFVQRVVYWLEWPAAKLSGFVFAVVGHFGACFDEWVSSLFDTEQPVARNLVIAACAAAGDEERDATVSELVETSLAHNVELEDLLLRTSFGWLGIAAVVALLGF